MSEIDDTPAHGVGGTTRRRNDAMEFPSLHARVETLAKELAALRRRLTSMEARMSGYFAIAVTIAEGVRYYLESLKPHH